MSFVSSAGDTVVLVDDNDIEIGYKSNAESHTVHNGALGYHHRGLTVMVYNSKGEVLLQHRKHRIFDKILDLSGSTHPYLRGGRQETYEEAAERCLRGEYSGLEDVKVKASTIAVNYSAMDPLDSRYCENEFCKLVIALYDGEVRYNSEAAYGLSWILFSSLVADVDKNPTSYAPWVVDLLRRIKEQKPRELAQLM